MKFKSDNCINSYAQEYNCTVPLLNPFINKIISVDKCLAKEIETLWDCGIETTGCCCGKHINSPPNSSFIGVVFKDINKMKDLNYIVAFNPMRPKDEDSFIPKTHYGFGFTKQ